MCKIIDSVHKKLCHPEPLKNSTHKGLLSYCFFQPIAIILESSFNIKGLRAKKERFLMEICAINGPIIQKGEVRIYDFYQVPKILDKLNISALAEKLYRKLYDLVSISEKNNWVDENGIYILFQRKSAMEYLRVSKPTAIKVFKELEDKGLIKDVRVGLNRPNKIYLSHLVAKEEVQVLKEKRDKSLQKPMIQGGKEALPREVKSFYPNNNNINNNKYIKNILNNIHSLLESINNQFNNICNNTSKEETKETMNEINNILNKIEKEKLCPDEQLLVEETIEYLLSPQYFKKYKVDKLSVLKNLEKLNLTMVQESIKAYQEAKEKQKITDPVKFFATILKKAPVVYNEKFKSTSNIVVLSGFQNKRHERIGKNVYGEIRDLNYLVE
jgi:DNA-binding Lrp family transcriptional regulator